MQIVRFLFRWTRRRWGRRCLLSVCSLGLTLLVVELFLQLFLPSPQFLLTWDTQFHHVHQKNILCEETSPLGEFPPVLMHINSRGLREEREIPLAKPRDEFRVLLLGDSFVEARQVKYEHTVGQRLERRLNEPDGLITGGKSCTVINTGVSSYSPLLEYVYFRTEGQRYAPDLVMLFFCWNDVTDDRKYAANSNVVRDARGRPIAVDNPQKYPTPPKQGLRLRLVELAERAWSKLQFRMGNGKSLHGEKIDYAIYKDFRSKSLLKNELAIFKEHYDEEELAAWEFTKQNLRYLKQYLDEMNVPLILIPIPAPPQIGPTQWAVGKVKCGLQQNELITSTKMQDILNQFCQENGIQFLDILPVLKRHSDKKLYFDWDGHWTEVGSRVVAEEVVDFLGRTSPAVIAAKSSGRATSR